MTAPNGGNTWRAWVLSVLLAAVTALVGIGIDENRRTIAETRQELRRLETMIQINGNRITRLEEGRDAMQRQLDRIEQGVDLLIRQHGTPPR